MPLPVAVVGAGPLGAATTVALTRRRVGEVVLIEDGNDTARMAQLRRQHLLVPPDAAKAELIRRTADAITARIEAGAAIRARFTRI